MDLRTPMKELVSLRCMTICNKTNDTAEFVPPQQNALGKITFICPFTNKKGTPLSQPEDLSQSHYATLCLLKTRDWARRYLSRLKGATIISIRSMW